MRAWPRRQRGVALLVAVLVVALATVLLAMMLDSGGVTLGRTRNLSRATQADAYATGLEDWAIDVLRRDGAGGGADSRADMWAQPLPPTPVPGGQISAQMVDLGGCFNLNNVARPAALAEQHMERLGRLLRALELNPDLALAIADWVDADFQPEMRGAEDQAYVARDPGYRAANRLFADVSELRLVRGIDGETYARLAPHVCALPETGTPLNVNTATVPVLMALSEGITEPIARRLARDGSAQYSSTGQFVQELQQLGVGVPADSLPIDVRSKYFLARAEIVLDGIPMAYASVLARGEIQYRVVSRNRAL